ncbi:MAG: discoidin domain-containing protein, partial [Christensenellaceae bacterium]|nr:discoidin domain-containing protein [Christensenellaceae bacterium]
MYYSKNKQIANFKSLIILIILLFFITAIAVLTYQNILTIDTAIAEEYEQGVINRLVNPANGSSKVLYGPDMYESNSYSYSKIFPSSSSSYNKYDDAFYHSGGVKADTVYNTTYDTTTGNYSHNGNNDYIIFDFGSKQWVSKLVLISRNWTCPSAILDFEIKVPLFDGEIPLTNKSTTDTYVKGVSNNNSYWSSAIISYKASVRGDIGAFNWTTAYNNGSGNYNIITSGSHNSAPKSVVFTPQYTRYVALVINQTWRDNIEIGEAAFYYTTPLKANATEQEKEAYDIYNYYNVSGGSLTNNATNDSADQSYYGYGGYANYTNVYAPYGAGYDSGDGNIERINNGSTSEGSWYHSSYNSSGASNSVYGSNAYHPTNGNSDNIINNDGYILIDLGTTRLVNGITYYPRSGGGNGTILDYKIYINKNPTYPGNENYYISNFSENDSRARNIGGGNNYFEEVTIKDYSSWANNDTTKEATFNRIYAARYIALVPTKTHSNNSHISCRELQIKNPGPSINLISSEQSLWNNVSSSGNHTGTFLLTNDIAIIGNAHNVSGSNNSNQASGSNDTRLSFEKNAVDTAPGSGADDGNWFSGVLLGGMHTIAYFPIVNAPTNTTTNVRQDASDGDTYHAFLTAHLRGGTLRDFNFVLDKKVYLTSYSTDGKRHGNVFGILVGVMDEGAVIDNVNVKINANCGIVAGGDYSGASGARQSWVVGGIVGRIRTASSVSNKNIIIQNVSLEMGDNSILSSDGKDDGTIAYSLASTGGAALVGGIAGLVL